MHMRQSLETVFVIYSVIVRAGSDQSQNGDCSLPRQAKVKGSGYTVYTKKQTMATATAVLQDGCHLD